VGRTAWRRLMLTIAMGANLAVWAGLGRLVEMAVR
jgi:hypothetical protein